ncbi:MAG: hypothetical protein IPQ00_00425 [Chloracidobacterium sp.]|nr:hypothetical protein [Chloracidobacterium sp.]
MSEVLHMYRNIVTVILAVILFSSVAVAQKAEVTVSLNEAFFDALLDSIYQNYDPPEFSVATTGRTNINVRTRWRAFGAQGLAFAGDDRSSYIVGSGYCSETVKILREMDGVRTAVRFREGKIYVPLAFSGNYAPPFVGCVEFAGWAETNIDLEFDQQGQRLIGKARVLNVNLNGTGGIGGTLIAKLIQSSIDKKLNPIEILRLDKVSFGVPIQNTGNIRMKAVSVVPEVGNGGLNIRIGYDFTK